MNNVSPLSKKPTGHRDRAKSRRKKWDPIVRTLNAMQQILLNPVLKRKPLKVFELKRVMTCPVL